MTSCATPVRRALTLLAAVLAVAAVALAGCSGSDPTVPSASGPQPAANVPVVQAEPRTVEAATALLDRAISRGISGDHAGAWDLFIPEDQQLIGRDQYVSYQATCNADQVTGVPYELTDVRLEGTDAVVGVMKVLGFSVSVSAFYRDGQWLTTLTDSNRAGAEHWVETGECLPE